MASEMGGSLFDDVGETDVFFALLHRFPKVRGGKEKKERGGGEGKRKRVD